MTYVCEAHLAPESRTVGLVRYFKARKRSITGWVILIGFVILNETRGLYMVAQFLKAWTQA